MKLDPVIELLEMRLNIQHQYNETLAFFMIDVPIQTMIMEQLMKTMRELYNTPSDNNKNLGGGK